MQIELRGLRLDHPGRYLSKRTVWKDDGGDLLTAIGYAPSESDHRPVIWVKAVVDRDLMVLLMVGIM